MSNKIKIGEWIDNKKHPLQELREYRYRISDALVKGELYETILVLFKDVENIGFILTLAGRYYPKWQAFRDWSGKMQLEWTNNEYWSYLVVDGRPMSDDGEVEIIAYMLIPECEVGRE
jgi:hypothetical protein